MGPELVLGEVLVVESVPEDVRGRAFAAMAVLTMLGMAVGYGVAGPMVEAIGARATIAWTAVAILALALLWIGPALRDRRVLAGDAACRRRADRTFDTIGAVSVRLARPAAHRCGVVLAAGAGRRLTVTCWCRVACPGSL